MPRAHRQPSDARNIPISLRPPDPVRARILALGLNTRIEKLRLERPVVDPCLVLIEHQLLACDHSASNFSSYTEPSRPTSQRFPGAYRHVEGESCADEPIVDEALGGEAATGENFGYEVIDGEDVASVMSVYQDFDSDRCDNEENGNESLACGRSAGEAYQRSFGPADAFAIDSPSWDRSPAAEAASVHEAELCHRRFLRSRIALASNCRTTVIEKQISMTPLGNFLRERGFVGNRPCT